MWNSIATEAEIKAASSLPDSGSRRPKEEHLTSRWRATTAATSRGSTRSGRHRRHDRVTHPTRSSPTTRSPWTQVELSTCPYIWMREMTGWLCKQPSCQKIPHLFHEGLLGKSSPAGKYCLNPTSSSAPMAGTASVRAPSLIFASSSFVSFRNRKSNFSLPEN